ncbi:type II toxin-antitoxin system VapC family toxin [Amycolatopsis sp. YIM 10]|uniref:type II toxin-antitoxin system VapC family toxin n=1 Tax=Amycolatopsis sp. YIM 10 TaxID=2653857 RepID=UPI00128FD63F|nr:type II toxin-antitoxin system VapC family toxin [Amycolatopsis sp. YIM 10]QFU91498.1 Ribonuclease VapC5 [Amycolatopsis sp. YIM 10]
MAERPEAGVLDTCAYLDLGLLDPAALPKVPELTTITMAELHRGVAMAKDAAVRAARTEKLGAAIVEFAPLPFDGDAAARYGTLVALVLAANRDPRPRRMDLMIAAIASSRELPLYTRNEADFKGLDKMVDVIGI